MRTVTIKLDERLKRGMASVPINWSEFLRQAISRRIEFEERRKAAAKLLSTLQSGRHRVPAGFINETIRQTRKRR